MKKILATFLLLLTLTAPLFGCDNSDISEASDPQSTAEVISRTTPNPETDFEYSALENGKEAFRSADITSVVMPQYLRTIRYYAFYDCTKLSQVILNDKVD